MNYQYYLLIWRLSLILFRHVNSYKGYGDSVFQD
jgi:hypothetical protein